MRRWGIGPIALSSLILVAGCDAASRRASARLRTENAALERQIESLEARTRELEGTLHAIETEAALAPDTAAQAPQVATLEVSPLSGFEPGASIDDVVLEVHVEATDGRQRPIQLVGPLEAQVLRARPGEAPDLLADVTLSPAAVRDAWRGSLFGATYLVPIPMPRPAADQQLLIQVFHDDLRTGRTLECSGGIAHKPSTETP
ncbi:MAG: hypothetical protein QF561_05380 [Phycisphaerales bacterium]|jgi:outer membrane murein-binding lipoprotein Lpp|nr:hypothetical protein [Phycisphaerales bacterium]